MPMSDLLNGESVRYKSSQWAWGLKGPYPLANFHRIGSRIGGRIGRFCGRIGWFYHQLCNSRPLLNMFDILDPLKLANGNRLTMQSADGKSAKWVRAFILSPYYTLSFGLAFW